MHTLGTLIDAAQDKSWKVRLVFAKNFAAFSESFGKEITDERLMTCFIKLLEDNEAEVKHAAIKNIPECLKNMSTKNIREPLLSTLKKSYSDATP